MHPWPHSGYSLDLLNGLVEPVNKVDASTEQFFVGHVLFGPPLQHLIERNSFDATELAVLKISVMDCLGDELDFLVSYTERDAKGFKGAVVAFMSEAAGEKCVEGHFGCRSIKLVAEAGSLTIGGGSTRIRRRKLGILARGAPRR